MSGFGVTAPLPMKWGDSLKVEEFEWIWCNDAITHEVGGDSLKVEEFEWIWCNDAITHEVGGGIL